MNSLVNIHSYSNQSSVAAHSLLLGNVAHGLRLLTLNYARITDHLVSSRKRVYEGVL